MATKKRPVVALGGHQFLGAPLKILALTGQIRYKSLSTRHFLRPAFYSAGSPTTVRATGLPATPSSRLGRGRLRRQRKHVPYPLHPLHRFDLPAQPQSHHAIVPIHPPGLMDHQ